MKIDLLSSSAKSNADLMYYVQYESQLRSSGPLVTIFNDNDNDKRLGLTAKADQLDHKKIQYTKNKN